MLNPTSVLNGNLGKMYDADGNWLTNVYQAQISGEITKSEIKVSGSRVTGHKQMSVLFSGSMTGYTVTTALAKKIGQVKDSSKASFVTQLVVKLDDPDNPANKIWVRLKGVQFDTIPLLNFEHGTEVTEETPFTFWDYEYL